MSLLNKTNYSKDRDKLQERYMKSIVSNEVLAIFPEYIRGVVSATNIHNQGENPN